ncbi:MAG: S41 family peptidase [Phycisphaerales bacterium]|nr:S41 family peptidase [Phycisphaerales bacterium]
MPSNLAPTCARFSLRSTFAACSVALVVAFSPFALAQQPPATTTLASVPDSVSEWSDAVWTAAKSGDLAALEATLKQVPKAQAAKAAETIHTLLDARAKHLELSTAERTTKREAALTKLRTELEKNDTSKALLAAVEVQTLSDDWSAVLALPEMQSLIEKAETGAITAKNAKDWMVAQEYFFRLRMLFDETGDAGRARRYDDQLDSVNQRIGLLASYAPVALYEMRKRYAERFEAEKPFPAYNEAFADDWKEILDGVSKGMLTSALTTAANEHISSGGWSPLIQGGLDRLLALAKAEELQVNFPGLAEVTKSQPLIDAIENQRALIAAIPAEQIGRPQYNQSLREILKANKAGPQLPDSIIYREFGDGAINELSDRFEDEYSQVIWPDQLRRFQQMVQGDFVGVGVQIRHDDKREIMIVSPLEGSPASRAGVKAEDRIVGVNGESTVGWSLNKAVDNITGPEGSAVTLSLRREGRAEPFDVKLPRESIKIRSVNGWWKTGLDETGAPTWDWYADKESGIGYVRLTSFNDDSFRDFLEAVSAMRMERPLHGLVLDLRFNPGGLLKSAFEFSNLFIESGTVVSGQDKAGNTVWRLDAEPSRAVLRDLPLVVLVNQGSASASEIVAGALKAHNAAVVLGERSFGKGSVQTVHGCGDQANDAQLKLTTQYYVLPPGVGETEGRLVHKRPGSLDWGVLPDLIVKMTPDQIAKSIELRSSADVLEEMRIAGSTATVRPNAQELLTSGVDAQLEFAMLILEARALKEAEQLAAAPAAGAAHQ